MFAILFRPSNQKFIIFIVYNIDYAMYKYSTCVFKNKYKTTTAYSLNNGVADISFSRRTNKAKNY